MKKIMITGDLGFIGKAVRQELEDHGYEVVGFDLQRSVNEDVLSQRSLSIMMSLNQPDVVVHLAAEVGKLNCELNSAFALDTNVIGTKNVAEACAKAGCRLVYVSTSEVYGDHGEDVVDEDTVENTAWLSGTYAITKLAGEHMVWRYGPPDSIVVRPTMPYGPGVPPGPGRRALDNIVYQAITGQPMVVHRGAARSWCWIGDVASAFRYVIEHGKSGLTYNVGRDDDEVEMVELARQISIIVGDGMSRVEVVDGPPYQTLVKRISCARLGHLGWAPETNLDQGLSQMIEWVRGWISAHEGHLED